MAYKMIGYFENWAQWRGEGWNFKPDQIDPSLYTHINFAFADFGFISPAFPDKGGPKLTGDFKVVPHEWNDESELYPALQKLKEKNPNLKTLISIGGWNFNDPKSPYSGQWTSELFSRMAASGEYRKEFIESAIEFAQEHGFDGIDIDWEYPGHTEQGGQAYDFGNFLTLLAEFRSAINGKNLLLTIASPAIVAVGKKHESSYKDPKKYFEWLGNCAQHLDWLNIMAYDYHGAFDDQTGVLAPLLEDSVYNGSYSLKNTVEAYKKLAKVPPEKLVLGLGTYGRTFKVTKPDDLLTESDHQPNKSSEGAGAAGGATKEAGVLAYYEIAQRLSSKQLERVWHDCTHTPYAYSTVTNEWVSYEDEESVAYKTSYLIREGLAGAMVWAIALDDFKNGNPLQHKIKEILDNPGKRPEIVWQECSLNTLPSIREDAVIEDAYYACVAVNDSGTVVQGFIDTKDKDALYVRVGKHTEEGVIWAARDLVADEATGHGHTQSQSTKTSIAINDNNYVVIVFTGSHGNESDNWQLYYRLGRIEGHSINWLSPVTEYDSGVNPSIALTNDNTLVGVHQAGTKHSSHFRYYRTGKINGRSIDLSPSRRFKTPDGEDELGQRPSVAVSKKKPHLVVEVHTGEGHSTELWYRVGKIEGGNIQWGQSFAQEDQGISPAVAILDDGYLVEVHESGRNSLWYKVGVLYGNHEVFQIRWLTPQAIRFGNGIQPSIALTGYRENYILVQTNKGDVVDGEFEDNRILTRASIPMVSAFVGKLHFADSVGIDLESHGIQLNQETDEWERVAVEIPPSSREEAWELFKLSLMWIPIIPDVISLIENSVNCDAGDSNACRDVGIDAAFLAIDIIPGGQYIVKAPAKAIVGVIRGVGELSKKLKFDNIIAALKNKDRNIGPVADWIRRNNDKADEIKVMQNLSCLRARTTSPRVSQDISVSNTVQLAEPERVLIPSAALTQVETSAVNHTLDWHLLGNFSRQENDELKKLADNYNQTIKKLREFFLAQGDLEELFELKVITPGRTTNQAIILGFRREDLYLLRYGIDGGKITPYTPEQVAYGNRAEQLETSTNTLQQHLRDLQTDNARFTTNGHLTKQGRHIVNVFSEAARFGAVRALFEDVIKRPNAFYNLGLLADALGDWEQISRRTQDVAGKRRQGDARAVGLDDKKAGGDGHFLNSHVIVCERP